MMSTQCIPTLHEALIILLGFIKAGYLSGNLFFFLKKKSRSRNTFGCIDCILLNEVGQNEQCLQARGGRQFVVLFHNL